MGNKLIVGHVGIGDKEREREREEGLGKKMKKGEKNGGEERYIKGKRGREREQG